MSETPSASEGQAEPASTRARHHLRPATEGALWITGFVVFFLLVYVFRAILMPFVAAMAVAYLLDPVCDRIERMGASRTLATTIVTIIFILVFAVVVISLMPLLINQISSLAQALPGYFKSLSNFLQDLLANVRERLPDSQVEKFQSMLGQSLDWFVGVLTGLLGKVVSGGVAIANLVSLIFITPVVAFYLLRDWDMLVNRIDRWLPRDEAETIREQVRKVDVTLAGFVRGQSMVCLILGTFYAVALSLAGLNFGLIIGLTAGILAFIPYVGTIVGFVASMGVALVQFDDIASQLLILAIFVLGQAVEGNFLTPKLVGERVGLHPVWVIFALLAGGALLGFTGILLAVPVAAVIGVLVRFTLERYLHSSLYWGESGEPDAAAAQPDSDKPPGSTT